MEKFLRPFVVGWTLSMVVLLACLLMAMQGVAQALPTASRAGALQVGGGYSSSTSSFGGGTIAGFTVFAGLDSATSLGTRWGGLGPEVNVHQVSDGRTGLYQRSYEFGERYVRPVGQERPYVRAMYGRGVLNFPRNTNNVSEANLAYNMVALGGGVELPVRPKFALRADVEYQRWLSGVLLPGGMSPVVTTVGVVYRLGGGKLSLPQ
jgi:hypothetical protein